MTNAAQCAKEIRVELKKAFPQIKFTVRSSNFAGGNAVDIRYENGVPVKDIEKITDKYQYGHFNGMEDIYEYSNNREDIAQAKYIMVQREISQEIREAVKQEVAKKFGIVDSSDEQEWQKVFRSWSDQVIWKELQDRSF